EEGAFGGIAFDGPAIFGLAEAGIVAEETGADEVEEVGSFGGIDGVFFVENFAVGCVADAGDGVEMATGNDGRDGHLVGGGGAGFVGADDGDGSDGFDGGKTADDGAAGGHALDAESEGDGEDGGKTFGDGGDSESDGGEEKLVPGVIPGDEAEGEGEGGERKD